VRRSQADTAPAGDDGSPGDDQEAAAPPPSLVAALAGWKRYRVGDLIGSGGGGFVWRAVDVTLDRPVALKLLRVDDAQLAARLLREAQAQARVDHPNVCKVYDAGVFEGRPYVAMQLVDGVTLDEAAPTMTLDERARVVRDVAEAIHAAHRIGLVHRDLKPSNVMVERRDDTWRAFVLDFGLARQMQATGSTATGQAMGTPAYMAPEQARGENTALDRRTDVYGLGATLYEALAGRAPFQGAGLDVLVQVVRDEPPPLRQIAASVPRDLETIVLKCLEKQPPRRYATAAALAADLDRFLDGEPVEARRPSAPARVVRWARRHRVLAAVALVALANLIGGGALALRTRASAQARARAAQQFGRSLEQVQAMAERARLLPLHDVREEHRAIRARIGELEQSMHELGAFAEGPGEYAVGRGYLALADYPSARRHLERAWELGERTPDAAAALGTALGEIYQLALVDARSLDAAARDARIAQLKRELRDPALERLRAAAGGTESRARLEGLIALYEDRYDDALRLASEAARASPWSWQAMQLEAQTRQWRAYQHTIRGELAAAEADLRAAGPPLESALAIARSSAPLYDIACDHWFEVMRLADHHGQPLDDAFAAVERNCAASRTIDPDRARGYLGEARALDLVTQRLIDRGRDPREKLARVIELAGQARARAHDFDVVDALEVEASADETLGDWQQDHGEDPRPSYARALELLEQVIARRPDSPNSIMETGNLYGKRAWLDDAAGRDPRPNLDAAEARFRHAHELHPEFATAWGGQGVCNHTRAEWLLAHGQDPEPSWRQAIRCAEMAVKLDPSTNEVPNLSAYWLSLARLSLLRGEDPSASIARAEELTSRSLEARPNAQAWVNRGEAAWLRARFARTRGAPESGELATAREALARSRALDGDYLSALTDTVELELFAARGAKPAETRASLERARASLERAQALQPKSALVALDRARWHRARAELGVGRAADEADAGLEAARASLAVRDDAEAHAVAGALLLDAARAGRKDDFAAAADELERALTADTWLRAEYAPLRDQARRASQTH
jgi:serine/threonine-protein kinase